MSELDQVNPVVETTDGEAQVLAPIIIEVQNPTADEMGEIIAALSTDLGEDVDVNSTTFNFKKGTDKDSGAEIDRRPVHLALPSPSVDGIVAILEAGGKGLELLQDCMATVINAQARDILSKDNTLNVNTFPLDQVAWELIANIPKATRKGGGIPKEVWEAFAIDYVAVIVEATGKSVEAVTNAANILKGKLGSAKTNIPVLNFLVSQLAIYAKTSPSAGEFVDCIEFLSTKADLLLNVSDEDLLKSL